MLLEFFNICPNTSECKNYFCEGCEDDNERYIIWGKFQTPRYFVLLLLVLLLLRITEETNIFNFCRHSWVYARNAKEFNTRRSVIIIGYM